MTEKINFLNTVMFVWATDLDRSVSFYTDILGCKLAYESEGWAELSIPGVKGTFLAVNIWKGDGPAPLNSFLTFGVSNLDVFRTYLIDNNVRMHGELQEFMEENQGIRLFKFLDPDGNILTASCIIS